MRDDLDSLIRENVSQELKAKVAAKVAPALERNRERSVESGAWAWILKPALFGAGLSAAAVAVVLVAGHQQKGSEATVAMGPAQYDLEMLSNAELLEDLDLLDQWEALKKETAKEWKKKS